MAMGSIDRLLAAMSVEIDAFALCDIAPDAALVVRPLDLVEVHFLIEGTLHFTSHGADPLLLRPGAIIVVPAQTPQHMAGSTDPVRTVDPRLVATLLPGGLTYFPTGGERGARIVCGRIEAGVGGSFGLFDGLDRPLHAQLGDDPLAAAAFTALRHECEQPLDTALVGGVALASALMKASLILLLRRLFAETSLDVLPRLFVRPSLVRALLAVAAAPQDAHSVVALAATAGMSRSSFARCFSASIGLTPMEYVAQARLARARLLLATTELPVATVASRAGFASRSHFSRSFRDAVGADPTSFRDQIREPALVHSA